MSTESASPALISFPESQSDSEATGIISGVTIDFDKREIRSASGVNIDRATLLGPVNVCPPIV